MDFNQALTYSFEDKQWVSKLAVLGVVLFLASIPFLGLVPLAAALGFMVQVIFNVRTGLPRPLPKWDDYGDKLTLGGNVVIAMLVYNLPLIVLMLITGLFVNIIGGGFLGMTVNLVTLCCAVPIFLIYIMLAWTILAAGIVEYSETKKPRTLYRVVHLFDVVRAHGNVTVRWALLATVVNVFGLITGLIPCLGWLAVLLFIIPIHAHLLGQYARQLAIKVA